MKKQLLEQEQELKRERRKCMNLECEFDQQSYKFEALKKDHLRVSESLKE